MPRVNAPVTREQKLKIVKLAGMGVSYRDLAARFGISLHYVGRILQVTRRELRQEAK